MRDVTLMTQSQEMALCSAGRRLHDEFRGTFSAETIERLLFSSFEQVVASATVTRFLGVAVERSARDRLRELIAADPQPLPDVPAVEFLSNDTGRAQMALGWFKRFAGPGAVAWSSRSAGPLENAPVTAVEVAAMAEVGIDISRGFAAPAALFAPDVVVTVGAGDACSLAFGRHYEDWEIADPAGRSIAEVRPIRDDIGRHVDNLLDYLALAG